MAAIAGVPQWSRRIDSTTTNDRVNNCTIGNSGKIVYLNINQAGTIDLYSGALNGTIQLSDPVETYFVTIPDNTPQSLIIFYNSSGRVVWYRFCPNIQFTSISPADTSVYLSGVFTGPTSSNLYTNGFGGTGLTESFVVTRNGTDDADGIIINLELTGKFLWANIITGIHNRLNNSISISVRRRQGGSLFLIAQIRNDVSTIRISDNRVVSPSVFLSSFTYATIEKGITNGEATLIINFALTGNSVSFGRLLIGNTANVIINNVTTGFNRQSSISFGVFSGFTNSTNFGLNSISSTSGFITLLQTFTTPTIINNNMKFMISFRLNGTFEWIRYLDGIINDNIIPMYTDTTGSLFFCPEIDTENSINLGLNGVGGNIPTQIIQKPLPISTGSGVAIIKYTFTGNFEWIRWIDSPINNVNAMSITSAINQTSFVVAVNSIYVVCKIGTSSQTINLIQNAIGGRLTNWQFTEFVKTISIDSTLIIKYSTNGYLLWIRQIPYYTNTGLHGIDFYEFFSSRWLVYTGYNNIDAPLLNQTLNIMTDSIGGNNSNAYNITTQNNSTEASIIILFDDFERAPTDIILSNTTILENEPINTVVGTFTTTDVDVGENHEYTLVSGTGSTDNAAFNILGNQLRSSIVFDFETKSSYSIRVRTTDNTGLFFEKIFTINIGDIVEDPTDIGLSKNTAVQLNPINTIIGILSTVDSITAAPFTYTLVPGSGSTDNAAFNILGDQLRNSVIFDINIQTTYFIRIRTTNNQNLFFEKEFVITILENEAPTDILLSNMSIAENEPPNSLIGVFSTIDSGVNDIHTYSFVSGIGSTDNTIFTIIGNELRANISFDFEVKSSYSIRVRTTDQGGLFFEKVFTITVTNVNETPTNIIISTQTIFEKTPLNVTVATFSTIDSDIGNTFTYNLVSGIGDTHNNLFTIFQNQLRTNATITTDTTPIVNIRVRTTDNTGLFFERTFDLTVQPIDETGFIPIWARRFGINPGTFRLNDQAVLSDDSVVVCGITANTISFDLAAGAVGGTITENIMPSPGFGNRGVLLKFSSNGELLWYRILPSTNLFSITVDHNDNIYVGGNITVNSVNVMTSAFSGDLTTPFTATKTNGTGNDAMILKFNTNGRPLYSRIISGITGNLEERISALTVDNTGNLFAHVRINTINSNINLTANAIGGDSYTFPNIAVGGTTGVLLIKYNSEGVPLWVRFLQGVILDINQIERTYIDADNDGNIVVCGIFTNTVNFTQVQLGGDINGSMSMTKVSTSPTTSAAFIVKYNSDGLPLWCRQVDNEGDDFGYSLKIDSQNNIVVGFQIWSVGTGTYNLAAGAIGGIIPVNISTITIPIGFVGFIIKYSDQGDVIFVRWITLSTVQTFSFQNLNIDDYDSIYVTVRATTTVNNILILNNNAVGGRLTNWLFTQTPPLSNLITRSLIIKYSFDGVPIAVRSIPFYHHSKIIISSFPLNYVYVIAINGGTAFPFTSFNLMIDAFIGETNYIFNLLTHAGDPTLPIGSFLIRYDDGLNPPYGINLSDTLFPENLPLNSVISNISALSTWRNMSFTYNLVAGVGDDDNNLFTITGNQLRTAALFDFETRTTYSIRIRTTDSFGFIFEQSFVLTVVDVNEPPINVFLAGQTIIENSPIDTIIGSFSTIDVDAGDTHTYSLVSGGGSRDNTSFTIIGNELRSAIVFDYERRIYHVIRVRSTDSGGLFFERIFIITVINVNENPISISLSSTSVFENEPINTLVGILTTIDEDFDDSHTYNFVTGPGDDNNSSFIITNGNELRTAEVFDFETKSSYSIRIRTTDSGGLFFERSFIINILDRDEGPNGIPIWLRQFTTIPETDNKFQQLAILSNNDVIVVGKSTHNNIITPTTVDIMSNAVGGSIIPVSFPVTDQNYGIIIKYRENGEIEWYRKPLHMCFMNVTIDNLDNIYVIGSINTTSSDLMFDAFGGDLTTPFIATKSSGTEQDCIILKIDINGKFIWSRVISGINMDIGCVIRHDNANNIYIGAITENNNPSPTTLSFATNAIGGNLTFEIPSTILIPASSGRNIILAKYTSSGSLLWIRLIDGGSGTPENTQDIFDMAVFHDGNIYISGYTNSNIVDFGYIQEGGDTSTSLALTKSITNAGPVSIQNTAAFLVKYNTNGRPIWGRQIDGTAAENAHTVTVDNGGNPIIAVRIESSSIINLGAGSVGGIIPSSQTIQKPTAIVPDVAAAAIIKYTPDGNFIWIRWIDTTSNDIPMYLTCDEGNTIYFAAHIGEIPQTFSLISQASGGRLSSWPFTTFTKSTTIDDTLLIRYSSDGIPLWGRIIPYYVFSRIQIRSSPIANLYYIGYNLLSNQQNQLVNLNRNAIGGNFNYFFEFNTHTNISQSSILIKFTSFIELPQPTIIPGIRATFNILSSLTFNSEGFIIINGI